VLLSLSQDNELDMLGDLLGDAMIAAMDGIELGELATVQQCWPTLAHPAILAAKRCHPFDAKHLLAHCMR
jgi:hypothetical protein